MLPPLHYLGLVGGVFKEAMGANELGRLFDGLGQAPEGDRLAVHFHGGLVSRAQALESAEAIWAPACHAAGAYPVFFVWSSDLLTTVSTNLDAIVQGTPQRRPFPPKNRPFWSRQQGPPQ